MNGRSSILGVILLAAALLGAVPRAAAQDGTSVAIADHVRERVEAATALAVERYFEGRLERSSYTFTIDVALDKNRVAELVAASRRAGKSSLVSRVFGKSAEETAIVRLSAMSPDQIRQYATRTTVQIGFAEQLGAGEWQPWVRDLKTRLGRGANVEGRATPQPLSERERIMNAEAKKARELADFEISRREQSERRLIQDKQAAEAAIERQREQATRRTLEHEYGLKNAQHEKEKAALVAGISEEQKRRKELAEQINRERIDETVARDMPVLMKFLSVGGILGLLVIVALIALAIGLILAALGLGKKLVSASKEAGQAIQSAFGGHAVAHQTKFGFGDDIVKQVHEIKKVILQKEDTPDDDGEVTPELLAELGKIVVELRLLIQRDLATAAAQTTKLIEGNEHEKTMMLFDLLGEETARSLFDALAPKNRRVLQRYFYTVGPKGNPPPKLLYLIAVSFRSMLTATEVLLKDDSHRLFSRMLLMHSDEELAHALQESSVEKGAAMLAILPPSRVVKVMRRADPKIAAQWRVKIVSAVRGEIAIVHEDIKKVERTINAPEREAFEESVKYLKELVANLDEAEAEDVLNGAEKDPQLKAAIGGLRASMQDLWVQPQSNLQRLFGTVELAPLAAVLIEAPPDVREQFLNDLAGRRKQLLVDELANLSDPAAAKKANRAAAKVRRKILEDLADLADQGAAELPFTRPVGGRSLTRRSA